MWPSVNGNVLTNQIDIRSEKTHEVTRCKQALCSKPWVLNSGSRGPHSCGVLAPDPNQTHLNKLIKFFRILRKFQAGEFDQGWS